jgi:hypothetical protein
LVLDCFPQDPVGNGKGDFPVDLSFNSEPLMYLPRCLMQGQW